MILDGPQFKGHDFVFTKARPDIGGSPVHQIAARKDKETVGTLQWHPKTGEINNIQVRKDSRRQGLATEMYSRASGIKGVKAPKHSDNRTTMGKAWSASLEKKK